MVLKLVDLVLMLKLDTTKLFKKQIIKIKIYFFVRFIYPYETVYREIYIRIFKLIIFLFKKDGFKTSRFSFNVKIRHYKTFQKTNY